MQRQGNADSSVGHREGRALVGSAQRDGHCRHHGPDDRQVEYDAGLRLRLGHYPPVQDRLGEYEVDLSRFGWLVLLLWQLVVVGPVPRQRSILQGSDSQRQDLRNLLLRTVLHG